MGRLVDPRTSQLIRSPFRRVCSPSAPPIPQASIRSRSDACLSDLLHIAGLARILIGLRYFRAVANYRVVVVKVVVNQGPTSKVEVFHGSMCRD